MLNNALQKIVEDVCSLGCNRVNQIIVQLEQSENIEGLPDLSRNESAALLHELKSIMAVYEKPI